jgi:hypothetical protein
MFSFAIDSESDGCYSLITLHLQIWQTKEIAACVVKASAMEEGWHNELDEPQDPKMNNKLLSATRDDNDAVMNYVGSSTNWELQTHCEHLKTVREIIIKKQQQRSVQTKLDSFFKPALLL